MGYGLNKELCCKDFSYSIAYYVHFDIIFKDYLRIKYIFM